MIGAACAHYLARAGWRVTILEKDRFGRGCSHGNCGYISPSHVLPLAEPGIVLKTLKWMLKGDAPLYVKPRIDLSLWAWMLRFARRANHAAMMESARGLLPLLRSTPRLYEELLTSEGLDAEWERTGCWFIYRTAEAMADYEPTDRLMREEFDTAAARYDGQQLAAMEPALRDDLAGAWLYESDWHVRPDKLMSGWRSVLERMGVQIREGAKVEGLVVRDGRVVAARVEEHGTSSDEHRGSKSGRGITASSDKSKLGVRRSMPDAPHAFVEIEADAFVIAAGAWTPQFARELGARIPIQPGKGYSITMKRPAVCPNRPMIFQEHKVAITPMRSGYRIGSTMEFAGYDATLNRKRLDALRRGADLYLREPAGSEVEEEWCGWRPMTWDSRPIIDRSRRFSNVWIAAGHSMLGLTLAPATGKLISELITGERPHVDPLPYSMSRFE